MITYEHAKPLPIAAPTALDQLSRLIFNTILKMSRVVHNNPTRYPSARSITVHHS